ncbi:hypothetical protein [Flavivirga sp. 57AJ16]|uniref:hypothetical protein n=1 Tax=Flavivirga sp. 57AJ16 TaxID=3025307 RepID=UPI0023667B1B|nr:hypothetical protein [Flavivirga sp. 57AJ16]MDD7887277.1 hypothetical protein [Flavivirga sp. 57AJ16]
MKKAISILWIGLLVLGCKKNTNVPMFFDYGSVKEGVYDNTFFKFKLPINPDWYILNNDEADRLYQSGNDLVSGNNESLKKTLDASMVNVAKLITVFKLELGATDDFNPSILINAENLKNYPGVDTPTKYLAQAKALIRRSAMDIEYIEEKDKVQIGSQDFVFMSLKNKGYGYEILQDYYVTLKKGFAISFIMSYTTEEDKDVLYKMFDKLKI